MKAMIVYGLRALFAVKYIHSTPTDLATVTVLNTPS